MHVTIFGATGGIGRHLLEQALTAGLSVTALTRDPARLEPARQDLRVIEGDVLDADAVQEAITGSDGVICALGMPLRNAEGLRARGTRRIVDAMEATGVRRLVCLSALGAGDSRAVLPWYYRYFLAPFLMNRMFGDHEAQEAIVTASSLDWTLVRPGHFTDGPRTGAFRHGFTLPDSALTLRIPRAEVAAFMLGRLQDRGYLHAAPALSC